MHTCNYQAINIGTELKFIVMLDAGTMTMGDYDFSCVFFTSPNKFVETSKAEMLRKGENKYLAIVDTTNLSPGEIQLRVTAYIPDGNCPDGLRTEVTTISTGVTIER